mmetsp:Transcript_25739/g.68751  ORF Transcript_25739/g.68751 Transcript_25739/m.68751 type:complete len:229 (-) Transcript_25739:253-939(-)
MLGPGPGREELAAASDPPHHGAAPGAVAQLQDPDHHPGGVSRPRGQRAQELAHGAGARPESGHRRLLLAPRRGRAQGRHCRGGRDGVRGRGCGHGDGADQAQAPAAGRGHGARARAALPRAEDGGMVALPGGGHASQRDQDNSLRADPGHGAFCRGEAPLPGHQPGPEQPRPPHPVRRLRGPRQAGGPELHRPDGAGVEPPVADPRGGRRSRPPAHVVPAVDGPDRGR